MAWSFAGRRVKPGCTPTHKNEANCMRFALQWRDRVTEAMSVGGAQLPLGLI
jgi:hypothetical protein